MARYIDADALMKDIVKRFGCRPYIEVGNKCEYIHNIVDEQPTAYDVDAVVAELEEKTEFLKDCTKYGNKDAKQQEKSYSTMMMYEVADLVDDLIDIVRNAGKDGAK